MIGFSDLRGDAFSVPMYEEYDAPEINKREIMRYSGMPPDASFEIGEAVIEQAKSSFTYRIVWQHISLLAGKDIPMLDIFMKSENLKKNLEGCDEAVIFAATVGAGIDHLIRRYERIEPARSLMLQAHGAERVEALCDAFNDDVKEAAKKAGFKTHPRFSPGYGDLPLDVQPILLSQLNAEKRLGITLGNSYMMSPSKSVTAIIGLERIDT